MRPQAFFVCGSILSRGVFGLKKLGDALGRTRRRELIP
jgi:hypothetical protein